MMTRRCMDSAHIAIRSVEVLGYPVGNLWHVLEYDRIVARVTYFDNRLVVVWGDLPCPHWLIEKLILATFTKGGA